MTPLLALFSFYDGMSSGEVPPEVVETRYGPALTEAQRLRWFSDFDSPYVREYRKMEGIKKKRRELGIEEDEEENERIVKKAKARVEVEMKRLQKEKEEREELEFIMKLLNED